jgi:CobQ-like glutamine amidotransferase family enzyme
MIRLGTLFPDRLNLNGDQGNIDVIARQYEWRGMQCEIVPVETVDDLVALDFVFIGHGSLAAWKSIEEKFLALTDRLFELQAAGLPAMAISSGFEKLVSAKLFAGLSMIQLGSRTSKFEVAKLGDLEVLGYVNTDVDLPVIYKSDLWLGSMLHGPVLAKNELLLEAVLADISNFAGLRLEPIVKTEKADQVADLIREVWKLERDLASE